MAVSILLRLLPATAADAATGGVRGQAEVVETGETALFKDAGEMLAFVKKVTDRAGAEGGSNGRDPTRE
jgi:hypothetical protein